MKGFAFLFCMVLLLASCGAGNKLNIVSPSLSEEETKERVHELPAIKLGTDSEDKNAAQQKTMQDNNDPPLKKTPALKETSPAGKFVVTDETLDALIDLMEKKGVITREELLEEMKRLSNKP
jgi:hypothetical protein